MDDETKISSLLEKYSQFSTDAIVNALTEHYIRTDLQSSAGDIQGVSSVKPLVLKMIHRLAALEADSFLIKQCLATDQRYVPAARLSTASPADILDQLLPRVPEASSAFPKSRLIELGPEVIGTGWYPAETQPDGYWRWSGPDRVATLMLPTVGSGMTRLAFEMRLLVPSLADGIRFAVDGRPASNVAINSMGDRRYSVSMETPVSERRVPSFLLLRVELPETVSPASVDGVNDERLLGIGLARIMLELIRPEA